MSENEAATFSDLEGPEPPDSLGIDHPVEVLAQAYMDLCSRVDEPFSVTVIDEARQSVGAIPQSEPPTAEHRCLLNVGALADALVGAELADDSVADAVAVELADAYAEATRE